MTTFTELESMALKVAQKSSSGNGHDFGYTEDIVDGMHDLTHQQSGGVITSLQKKGVFEWVDGVGVTTDSGECHQFCLNAEYQI